MLPTPQPPTCHGGKADMEKAFEVMLMLGSGWKHAQRDPNLPL